MKITVLFILVGLLILKAMFKFITIKQMVSDLEKTHCPLDAYSVENFPKTKFVGNILVGISMLIPFTYVISMFLLFFKQGVFQQETFKTLLFWGAWMWVVSSLINFLMGRCMNKYNDLIKKYKKTSEEKEDEIIDCPKETEIN